MVRYQYQRIHSQDEFRLLELLPGSDDQQIQCRLTPAHIKDNLKYEALSYCWGPAETKNEVLCDGKTLLVPRNSTTALYWLRYKKKSRFLWIDAICIDQGKDEAARREFGNQLRLAAEIYSNAVHVVAFLGSGTRNTKFIMQYLRLCGRLMRYAPFNSRNPRSLARPISSFQALLSKKTGLSHQQFVHELRAIIENEYFTRAWTVQEIAVSRDCKILCGDTSMSWTTFGIAARCITPELDSEASKRQDEIFRSYMIHWMLWKRFRRSITGDQHARLHNDGLEQCDLGDVLRYSKYQHATHKKDKVWALYGVFRRLGIQLNDDYMGDELQVFSTATFEVIRESKSLKVFLTLPEHNRSSNLPSWVPDWTQDYPFTGHLNLDHFKATAGSHCDPQLVQSSPNAILKLRGRSIGRVTDCLSGNVERWEDYNRPGAVDRSISSYDKILWQIQLVQEWMRRALSRHLYWKPNAVLRRFFDIIGPMVESRRGTDAMHTRHLKLSLFCDFWRTSTTNISGLNWIQTFPHHPTTDAQANAADHIPAAGDDPRVVWDRVKRDKHTERYLNVLIEKMNNYNLFTDSCGRVGLAFHSIQPKHEILLLEGLAAPILAAKDGERWRIVAPAYISDVMNGQAWSDTASQLGDFEFQ